MSETSIELKQEIQKSLSLMRTLRDEVRVKIHLAGMDAKDEWSKLESHMVELEHAASDLSDATYAALAKAIKRLKDLRSSLKD